MTLREIIYQAAKGGNSSSGSIVLYVNKATDGAYEHGTRFIHGALYAMSNSAKWKRRGFNKLLIGGGAYYHIGCADCEYYRMTKTNYCGGCGVRL